jgi:hypothetical protein
VSDALALARVLLSPSPASPEQLGRALLALARTPAAAPLARELHGRIHGEPSPCRRCDDPRERLLPLLLPLPPGPAPSGALVADSLEVYEACRGEVLPRPDVLFRSAGALALAGHLQEAALVATVAHDHQPGHSPSWCDRCDRLLGEMPAETAGASSSGGASSTTGWPA